MKSLKAIASAAKTLRRHQPFSMLIFFVTSRCNSVCRTCFYWDSLNQRGHLTFDEIRKISASMPEFTDLWLSGGEPTLRDDLVDIIDLFRTNNKITDVKLPTNGLLTDRIERIVDEVCTRHPDLTFHINLALDGYGETHDRIRGVPGNFDKALQTIAALTPRRMQYDNFYLFVNSVICKENHEELMDLGNYIRDHTDVDGHYFQIIRGNALEEDLLDVPMESLKTIYQHSMRLNQHYLSKTRQRPDWMPESLFEMYYMGTYLFTLETQFNNADHNARWSMPCQAGTTAAALDYDGKFRICELREPVGNLRDYDCDFNQIWTSQILKEEVAQMHKDQCDCTHICFLYNTTKNSKHAQFIDIPKRYRQYKNAGYDFNWLEATQAETLLQPEILSPSSEK